MSEHPSKPASAPPQASAYDLRLYVAGATPKSVAAFRNLERLCEDHLGGRYSIKVIDLMKNPELAHSDQIIAVPTVVRKVPKPVCRIVGTLANSERVLDGLDLRPRDGNPFSDGKGEHDV